MKNLSIQQDTFGDNPSGLFTVNLNGIPIASFDFKLEAESFLRSLRKSFSELLKANNGHEVVNTKATLQVTIPKDLDIEHAMTSVADALYLPDNVTQTEYNFVLMLLDRVFQQKLQNQ